ncbi:Translation factor guf1 mitochondrial [Apiospora saccharicola]
MAVFGPEGDLPDPPAWTTPHFSSLGWSAANETSCGLLSGRPSNHRTPVAHTTLSVHWASSSPGTSAAWPSQPRPAPWYTLPSSRSLGTSTSAPSTPARASRPASRQLLRAFAERFEILPVIHEIDLSAADVLCVLDRLEATSEPGSATAIGVGPKTRLNVQSLVLLVGNIPTLNGNHMKPLRMLLVASWCDELRGVICLVRVFDGTVCAKTQNAKIGHAFTTVGSENMVAPFPGFEELKLMVFATAFPPTATTTTVWLVLADRARGQYHHRARRLEEGGLEGRHRVSHADPAKFPARTTARRRRALQAVRGRDGDGAKEYLGRVTERCEANRDQQESIKGFPGMSVIKHRLPTAQLVDLFGKLKGAARERDARRRGRWVEAVGPGQAAARQQGARRRHQPRRVQVAGRVARAAGDRQLRREFWTDTLAAPEGFDDRILNVLIAGVEDPPYAEVLAAVLVARAGRAHVEAGRGGELDVAAANAPDEKDLLVVLVLGCRRSSGQEQRHGVRLEYGGGGGAVSQRLDGRLGEGHRVEGLGEEASVGLGGVFEGAAMTASKHRGRRW